MRVHLDSGYIPFEKLWREPPGSGAVTRQLLGYLQHPEIADAIAKFDKDPAIRRKVMDFLEHDAALAEKTGQPLREDLQRAREILATEVSAVFLALSSRAWRFRRWRCFWHR